MLTNWFLRGALECKKALSRPFGVGIWPYHIVGLKLLKSIIYPMKQKSFNHIQIKILYILDQYRDFQGTYNCGIHRLHTIPLLWCTIQQLWYHTMIK